MCCAELEGTLLLVAACGYSGLRAYNPSTKYPVWEFLSEIPFNQKDLFARNIATDDHGRLFVLDDKNKCIHVFSVGGKFVTTLLRKGERGLGELRPNSLV